jgi:uncharacterized protein YjbI with pentapeptide repeats
VSRSSAAAAASQRSAKLRSLLREVAAHHAWLKGKAEGERANLSRANFAGLNLHDPDLSNAEMRLISTDGVGTTSPIPDLRRGVPSIVAAATRRVKGRPASYAGLYRPSENSCIAAGERIAGALLPRNNHRMSFRGAT